MNNDKPTITGNIVLPENPGLKDAYLAILKEMYAIHKDKFWMQEIIDIIALDCGISLETAKERFKQLDRFKLLKYLNSSLSGHKYVVLIYCKKDGQFISIDSWLQYDQLIESQFGSMVETDLVKIRRTMNSSGLPGLRVPVKELESELKKLDNANIIHPGEDTIKSEFKTLIKVSSTEVVQQIEDSRNEQADEHSSTSDGM